MAIFHDDRQSPGDLGVIEIGRLGASQRIVNRGELQIAYAVRALSKGIMQEDPHHVVAT